MTLYLSENTINSENVVENIVEKNERNIQLLFIKDAQPCFRVFPEYLPVDRNIVLGCPIGVEDWSTQSFLLIDGREMFHGYDVDVVISPVSFLFGDETVLKESKCLMSPNAN